MTRPGAGGGGGGARRLRLLAALVLPAVVLVAAAPAGQQRTAAVWVTTADRAQLLARLPDAPIQTETPGTAIAIELFPQQVHQPITGFGASLTESSAYVLDTALAEAPRQALFQQFFDAASGAGLSVLRQPIGASDFALSHYSYDDMPPGQSDPLLQRFSIARDRQHVLPALRRALQINPAITVMASPWSAPGWMKSSGSMIDGSLRRDAYAPYAEYFVRFLQAYAAEGVPVRFVTVQNEPHFTPPDYPGTYMPAADQAQFIRDHLGPALTRAGLTTAILAWDSNWDQPHYPIDVLNDAGARPFVAGSAFHCYKGDPAMMEETHAAHPGRSIHLTECSSFTSTDFAQTLLWNARVLLIGSLRHWAESIVAWNLVLDETGGPHAGGCPDCTALATVDRSTGRVTFNAEFYALAHVSRFVRPGAVRIGSDSRPSDGIDAVAMTNPDGSHVVLLTNSTTGSRAVKLRLGAEATTHAVPARSVMTVVWPGASSAPPDPFAQPIAVPGTIEAERFGPGGRGVSYADTTPGNAGGQYRATDVDIEQTADAGGGYNLGWLRAGEWTAYALDVRAEGSYTLEARVASRGPGGTFHVEIDGVDRSGPLTIPDTGGWQSWVTLTRAGLALQAGARRLRIVIDGGGPWGDAGNINYLRLSTALPPAATSPYHGTPAPIPGTIEAEEFDLGAEGAAYFDLTPGNAGGTFRQTAVDIQPASSGGYNVGWMEAREWLAYTVDAGAGGSFSLETRVASNGAGGVFHLEADGTDVSGPISIPDTGGWQKWTTLARPVTLSPGTRTVRVVLDGAGASGAVGNLDWLRFTAASAAPNLALKRPATSSSIENGSYPARFAVDGDPATRWSSAFSDPQWIAIDLGSVRTVRRILLRWETAYSRAYQVQASIDGNTWTTIAATAAGDGGVDDWPGRDAAARYVRVYGTARGTPWGHSLWEIEVY